MVSNVTEQSTKNPPCETSSIVLITAAQCLLEQLFFYIRIC
jgi:hypothetical protein